MKLRFRFGLCSLLFGLTLGCASPRAHAATLTVCPSGTIGQNGCQYIGGDNIQTAVDAATSGDTILLRAGTYTRTGYSSYDNNEGEPRKAFVLIPQTPTRTLTLQGESTAILDGASSTHALSGIVLQGGTTTVRNLSIQGMKRVPDEACVDDNQRCGKGSGIYIDNTAQFNLINNTIMGNQNVGIHVLESAIGTIINNISSRNQDNGVSLADSAQATIINNTLVNNGRSGLDCTGSSSCFVTNNISSNNEAGGIIGEHSYNLKRLTYNNSSTNGGDNFNVFLDPNQLTAWGNVKLKPLFVSETDFHLQPGSPGINIGDPALFDPDGSRSDMGAYGGPGAHGSIAPTPTINPSPPPANCNASCSLDSQCGQNNLFCRVQYSWSQWQNVSANVANVGSGKMTSFAVRDNNGVQEQHLVKGGEIWYREGRTTGWTTWENVTHYIQNVGTGTITSFKAFTNAAGIVEQYLVRGGKVWYQEGRPTGYTGFQDATTNVDGVGSGTITSFSGYLAQGSQIHQHLVRDGKIYTHDNIRGWSEPWQEVTSNMNGVGEGSIDSFTTQIINSKLDQYFVRNGVLYNRTGTFTHGACRLRTNPNSDTCMEVLPPTSTPPLFPSPTPGFSPSPPPPLIADYNGDGVVNLLDLNLAKQRIAQGTFTIFHYNNVIQALLQ